MWGQKIQMGCGNNGDILHGRWPTVKHAQSSQTLIGFLRDPKWDYPCSPFSLQNLHYASLLCSLDHHLHRNLKALERKTRSRNKGVIYWVSLWGRRDKCRLSDMKPTRPGVNWRLWLVVLWLLTDWKVSGFIPYFCRLQVSVGDMLCHARYNHLFTCVFE